MEVGGIGKEYAARQAKADDAAVTDATIASAERENPADDRYDRLIHGLATLKNATSTADEEAKARARQKLQDAKQQLQFLQRWGFDPEVVARQAALLGVAVAAAAREFTDALTPNGATAPLSGPMLPPDGGSEAAAEEPPQTAAEASDTTEDADQTYSQAERAYMDVMDDGNALKEKPTLSPDDIRTAAEFSAIARQIKALLEDAARKLREQKNAGAVPGSQNLDAAVNALAGTVSGMPAAAVSIVV